MSWGNIALSGVLHSESDKTNMKQRSPDRSILPSPLKQAVARGTPSRSLCGSGGASSAPGPGRESLAEAGGEQLSLSRRSSPGNIYNFAYSASPA